MVMRFTLYEKILYPITILAIGYFLWISSNVALGLQNGRLLAYASTAFLYLSLLASALNAHLKAYPLRMWLTRNRKSHGIAAFLFAEAHGFVMVFKYLGGPQELMKADAFYQISIFTGVIASYIFVALAATSSILAMRKLGVWWKILHRTVYVSAMLVMAHIVLIRIYYTKLFDGLSLISLALFMVLLVLELMRLWNHIQRTTARARTVSKPSVINNDEHTMN